MCDTFAATRNRAERGKKCPTCGHALSRHNSLGYCRHQSRRDGYCICGDWRAERLAAAQAAARASGETATRCNDCGVKVEGFDNYVIYDPGLGRAVRDYCRRCYGKVNFGTVAKAGEHRG